MFTVLLSFCVAAFLFALVRPWWRRRRLLPGLPVPSAASWVCGHEKDIFEAETGTKYTAWADKLGPTYKIKLTLAGWCSPFDWARRPNSELTCDSSTRTLWLQQTQGRSIISFQRIHTTTCMYHHSPVFRPLIERVIRRGYDEIPVLGMRSNFISPAYLGSRTKSNALNSVPCADAGQCPQHEWNHMEYRQFITN